MIYIIIWICGGLFALNVASLTPFRLSLRVGTSWRIKSCGICENVECSNRGLQISSVFLVSRVWEIPHLVKTKQSLTWFQKGSSVFYRVFALRIIFVNTKIRWWTVISEGFPLFIPVFLSRTTWHGTVWRRVVLSWVCRVTPNIVSKRGFLEKQEPTLPKQ